MELAVIIFGILWNILLVTLVGRFMGIPGVIGYCVGSALYWVYVLM